jgi:hypothetical protein
MATGDQSDVLARIKAVLPRWFGSPSPILDGVLAGYAWSGNFVYQLLAYVKAQTRIATASDGWLDLIVNDFFGSSLVRAANQSDASLRAKILVNLIRQRGTRAAIVAVLQQLTGRTPLVFEPARPADTGCYGGPTTGYGLAGGYGSLLIPFQCFVIAYRPLTSGIPLIAGYGVSTGGYSTPSQAEYASLSMIQGAVADADIYAAIDSVKPAATEIWTRLQS